MEKSEDGTRGVNYSGPENLIRERANISQNRNKEIQVQTTFSFPKLLRLPKLIAEKKKWISSHP